jgi:Bacterial protein of unknown function (DUF899)
MRDRLLSVVSRDEWVAARLKLLAQEKEAMRAQDAVTASRRELPMVRIDKAPPHRLGVGASVVCPKRHCANTHPRERGRPWSAVRRWGRARHTAVATCGVGLENGKRTVFEGVRTGTLRDARVDRKADSGRSERFMKIFLVARLHMV